MTQANEGGSQLISNYNPEVAAFDVGLLIPELRWHVQVATLTGSRLHEDLAKKCAAKLQPLLSSLFPEQRGGKASEIVRTFRDSWDTLDTESYAETFKGVADEFGVSLDLWEVVEELQRFVDRIDEPLYSTVLEALHDDPRQMRAFQLGMCVKEGVCPTKDGGDFWGVVGSGREGTPAIVR